MKLHDGTYTIGFIDGLRVNIICIIFVSFNIVGSKLFIPGKLQYMEHDCDHHLISLVKDER